MRIMFACAAAAVLAGCVPTMAAAPAGTFQAPAQHISVALDHAWTYIPPGLNAVTNGAVLTRHGIALDRVDLISIANGESIVRAARDADVPRYRTGMSDLETVELVTSSLSRMGFTDVTPADVRPHQLSGANGVRFNVTGRSSTGLNVRGDVVLAQANGKLNLMLYLAPAAHYYEAFAPEFERMVQTAQVSS